MLWVFRENVWNWLIGQLITGLYLAFLLVGNHEREKSFPDKSGLSFFDHQIAVSRNYKYDGLFWLIIMGGMQYQVEHHLFPKVPFYRIREVAKIVKAECDRRGKSLIVGPIIGQ